MEDAADEGVELRNRLDAAITDAAFYSLDDDYMSVDINLAREAALRLRHRARNEWVERRRMRFGTACERIMADIGEDLSVGSG
jgi:hypothetical protein